MNVLAKFVIVVPLCSLVLAAAAQTVRVQIVDGKTGKPVVHEHVNFFRNENFADVVGKPDIQGVVHGFITDEDGVITTSEIGADAQTVGVSVDGYRACSKRYQWFSLPHIFSSGLVGKNSCKPKIRQETAPGTLIFYVRPETFFEKMAH